MTGRIKTPAGFNFSKIADTAIRFRSSIYGRVVFTITISSVFLFLVFWLIFRSVNESYMSSVINQNGSNIASLVESALYESMLENDRTSLQRTLDVINSMSGVDDVNMYDANNNLAFSSISDTSNHSDPDCKSCHTNIEAMFPAREKSFRVIDIGSECSMNHNNNNMRHLLIKSPILNSPSCYTAECHAHPQSEEVLGSLFIKFPMSELDSALSKSARDYFMLAAVITVLLVISLIIFTVKNIRNPLNSIILASEAVARGDRDTRLDTEKGQLSDMKMVASAFNDMLDNLQKANTELENWSHQLEYKVRKKSEELGQAQNELINIEKIASLGRLSLSVAHEINNPLSGILVYSKLIQKQLNNNTIDETKREQILKHLRFIENESKRCGDIVKGLLDFSRKDQNNFERRHLNEILHETFDLMAHTLKVANISFLSDLSARNDLIFCSPNQIKQVCVALLVNSMEAISEKGEIVITTSNPDEGHIRMDITDNGTGISPEDLPHIFEPFFSTKEKANGTGLGLAIVHGIVKNHHGTINVKSERGSGTTVSINISLSES
jgi:two-component system NtrC family sensor kinase